jgi:SAM-dependent methyltransferase
MADVIHAEGDNSDRYTSGEYLANNPTWHEEDSEWKTGHIVRLLEQNDVSPRSICEVGCGTGGIVELIAGRYPNAEVQGYEISPQALEGCLARPPRANLAFFSGSPFDAGRRFDLMMAIDVIEHVEDPFAFVRAMAKTSDWQVFHIPLDMNALAVGRGWVITDARSKIGHLHYFARDTALSLLNESGLDVVDDFYTPWAIDQSYKSWKKQLAAWPRRLGYAIAPHAIVRLIGGWSLMVLTRTRRGA